MAAGEAGSLFVRVGADVSNFMKGMAASDARMRSFGAGMARHAKMGALALGGGLGYAVKIAATFEQQMSQLRAVTGASATDMVKMKDSALKLGAATKFSARDVAAAQVELGKAGLSTSQILGGALKSSLALAAAGNIDLAQAAEITVNTMGQFGLKAKSTGMIADALATAANATTSDVGELGQALENVGPVAKSAGLSFKQTVVGLELLSRAGTKGAEAGTNLRSMLTNLATPTAKASKMMKDLGLDFFDAQGNFKDFATVSTMLRDKLGGLTAEQRQLVAATIAGSYGQKALFAIMEGGPAVADAYARGLDKTGTAAKTAEIMNDNLAGKLEQLTGALETAAISIGTALIPALTDGAKKLADFIQSGVQTEGFKRALSDIGAVARSALSMLADAFRTVGPLLGKFLGMARDLAASPMGPALLGAAAAVYSFAKAVTIAKVAAAAFTKVALLNPWVLFTGAVIALTGAILGYTSAGNNAVTMTQRLGAAASLTTDAMSGMRNAVENVKDADLGLVRAKVNLTAAVARHNEVNAQARDGLIKGAEAARLQKEASLGVAEAEREVERAQRRSTTARKESNDAVLKALQTGSLVGQIREETRALIESKASLERTGASKEALAAVTKTLKGKYAELIPAAQRVSAQYDIQIARTRDLGKRGAITNEVMLNTIAHLSRMKEIDVSRTLQTAASAAAAFGDKLGVVNAGLSGLAGAAEGARGKILALKGAMDALRSKKVTATVETRKVTSFGSMIGGGGQGQKEMAQVLNPKQLAKALREASATISGQKAALSRAFAGLSNAAMKAFDDQTSQGIARIGKKFAAQFANVDTFREGLTPAEAEIQKIEDARDAARIVQSIADAERDLAKAQTEGDPEAILAAQRSLDDARLEQRLASLRTQAVTERTERDKIAAEKLTDLQAQQDDELRIYEATRDIERQSLENHFKALEGKFARGKTMTAAAQEELVGILNSYGIDFQRSGERLGDKFGQGLQDSILGVGTVAEKLAKAIAKYLKLKSPADKGPLASLDTWFTAFTPTLLSGLDMGAVSDAVSIDGGSFRGRAAASSAVHITVTGNTMLGSEREIARRLADIIAPETGRRITLATG